MELVETLENILSNDKNLRLKSEEAISSLIEKGFQEYMEKMAFILTDERFNLKVRQMAATLIKNPILYIPKIQEQWLNLDITIKDNIRNQILSALGSENELIRNVTGSVIAAFAKVETPISNKWKSLLPCLCQTNFGNDKFLLSAVQTLGFIAEEVSKKDLLSEEIDQILYVLVMSIQNNINNIQVVSTSLKAIVKVLPLIGSRKMEIKDYALILFNQILVVGEAYSTNEKVLEILCRIFIELAENYYYTIEFFIKEISSFSFVLIGGNNKSLALLALEFWCRLGSEESNKVKNDLEKKLKSSKGYFQQYFEQLYEIIDKFIIIEDDDEDEWNMSKASCFLLVSLVKTINENSLKKITKDVDERIKSDDANLKKKCLLKLTACFETVHKTEAFNLALQYLNKLFTIAKTDNSYEIRLIASKALAKLTKLTGAYLQPQHLASIIPTLLELMYTSNKIGIFLCQTINNLIISLGDLKTQRGTNSISPFFESIYNQLIKCDSNPNFFDREANLATYSMMTLENLISYSSHDKQSKLTDILVFYVIKIKELPQRTDIMSHHHIIEDLESYYCLIIRTTIKKFISTLQLNDCQNIYEVIIGTFMRRKNIYDEGLLAISSFAINIKKNFKVFMSLNEQSFNTYLKHSLGKEMYNNSFLLNAGVIALEDVVKALEEDFSYFTAEYIPLLTGILGSDDVKKEIKLPVISIIGVICLRTKENFIPFLEDIMKILFGACVFSLTDSSLDPELEEYFNRLRFALVETFTLIVFGLEDCNKLDIFSKYVADIFSFFKRLIDLGNQINLDTKKGVLGFTLDLINIYGRDLISILDTSLLSKLIFDLKECTNKEYNRYAIETEESLKIYFK